MSSSSFIVQQQKQQEQQERERKFPSCYVAKLCRFCKSPIWIEFDPEQKVYVDMNTQHKHICQQQHRPTLQYKISNISGHDNEFTEEQAIVTRLNSNWRSFK